MQLLARYNLDRMKYLIVWSVAILVRPKHDSKEWWVLAGMGGKKDEQRERGGKGKIKQEKDNSGGGGEKTQREKLCESQ